MITKEASMLFDLPVGQVFTAFVDSKNQPKWDKGLLEACITPDGPVGLGTRITEVRRLMGRTSENTGEVIEFEPNAKITRKSVNMPMTVLGTVTFSTTPQGTKVNWKWDLQPKGFYALVGPLIASSMKKGSENSLRGLKDFLESRFITA